MSDQCDEPLATDHTDSQGFAELSIDAEAASLGPIAYLEFNREEEGALGWQYAQSRPLGDKDYVAMDLIADEVLYGWHEIFSQALDDEKSTLIVVPADCAGMNAKRVSLEAWRYEEGELKLCDDCYYAYSADATEKPDPMLVAYGTSGLGGYIANVPPGVVYVVLRRAEAPHDMVSAASLLLGRRQVGVVRIYPASAQELLTFPDPKK